MIETKKYMIKVILRVIAYFKAYNFTLHTQNTTLYISMY